MEDTMGLLAALFTLLCVYAPVCGAERCSGFRHLENGQTFFRYGGLLVIFRCRPGFKLHGYKTNSCVSGHWSRDTPVCVGSGCFDPGPLPHGTSSMNADGSWAVFSCDSGFWLHGPSMLYCKGHTWNSTKPECREADMMSSFSGVHSHQPNILHQNRHTAAVSDTQQQPLYNTLDDPSSREANFKPGFLSHTPSQMSKNEKEKVTNMKIHLEQQSHAPNFKVKDGFQTSYHETQLQETNEVQVPDKEVSEAEVSQGEAENLDRATQMFASSTYTSITVSSELLLVSGIEQSVSSAPSFSILQTPTILPTGTFTPTSQLHLTESAPPLQMLKFEGHDVSLDAEVASSSFQAADKDQEAVTGLRYHVLSQTGSTDKEEPTEASTFTTSSSSTSLPSSPPPPQLSSFTTQISATPSPPKNPQNSSTATKHGSHWTENHKLTPNASSLLALSPVRRPICPYPPVPIHGTFYFRNVKNPGVREYRHYIQYACYPGYTLAHGDVYSYCQQGRWSGITPVCLESMPCSLSNGGCSQLCSHSLQYNQSFNQTLGRTECHCRPGFTLLDDGQTCRDVDECVEEQHQCQQRCDNTFGSFKCSCDDGYQQAQDQISCTDTDECADNQGLGPCMEQCHNTPGSYYCSCTHGHILAINRHSCIRECPPGYRKHLTITPDNTTVQNLREECVDINECQEDRCGLQCVNLPGSYKCTCPRGYTLQGDGRHCKDINECSQKNGGCSHLCVNQKGGYKCVCPVTHRLSSNSWKKCLPRVTSTPPAYTKTTLKSSS